MFDGLIDSIADFFYTLVLYVDMFACKVIGILYSLLEVFAGLRKVSYVGDDGTVTYDYLINFFFSNKSVNTIYWGMALIGIVLCFGFTIYAVIKKIFDVNDTVKSTLGGILGNLFKSILLILLMNFVLGIALDSSNVLIQQIEYLFDNTALITQGTEITFEEDDYATMARILNTIGNYSLNPSRDSKYNINACYNEIRGDMLLLDEKRVFNFSYQTWEEVPVEGKENTYEIVYTDSATPTWQSALVKIANAQDLSKDMMIDDYNQELADAILECMDNITYTKNFYPLEKYSVPRSEITSDNVPLDAIVFLSGTIDAAKNPADNENASIFDNLRYDYIKPNGKSIYDVDQVKKDFDISFSTFDHLIIIGVAYLMVMILLGLCVNCVARIFNMMLLYLIAPLCIAVKPLDEGEKTKQWGTAFIVQTFGVIGSVLGIRIMMLFIPIIFNANLILFENSMLNFLSKIVMLVAVSVTVEQASRIVTGILANNAGFQSLQAGDVGGAGAQKIMGTAMGLGKSAMGMAATVSGTRAIYNGVSTALSNSGVGRALRAWGGGGAMSKQALNAEDQAQQQKAERLDNLKYDLRGNGQVASEARKQLASMSATEARDKYGMNERALTDLKNQYGAETMQQENEGLANVAGMEADQDAGGGSGADHLSAPSRANVAMDPNGGNNGNGGSFDGGSGGSGSGSGNSGSGSGGNSISNSNNSNLHNSASSGNPSTSSSAGSSPNRAGSGVSSGSGVSNGSVNNAGGNAGNSSVNNTGNSSAGSQAGSQAGPQAGAGPKNNEPRRQMPNSVRNKK